MDNEILKQLRVAKGMTQEELAKAIGVSPSTVGMYEQGRRSPDHDTLKKLSKLFNVTIDYLLKNEEYAHAKQYIDELKERLKKKGYDISDMSYEEIADLLEKGLKLDEIYKSK